PISCSRALPIPALHSSFFYRYADPRALHSFPTRRSSDLSGRFARGRRAESGQRSALSSVRDRNIRPIAHQHHQHASDAECPPARSEEHTSELQSLTNLVCRLLLEKKKHHATKTPSVHANS